jgi:plasmid maintenance system antidote protein VapI
LTDLDRLARAGRLLYGDWWHTRLAAALGVARKTVQRWASGEQPVPPGIWIEIRGLLELHAGEARAFARTLPKAA